MPLLTAEQDVLLRRSVGGGKGGSTLHRNHAIFKFDINDMLSKKIKSAAFNWFLFSNNMNASDSQTIEARRYFNTGGADTPQVWTEITGAASLVSAADWTALNTLSSDSKVFTNLSPQAVYSWDIKSVLQGAIDDNDGKFTILMSRAGFNVSGTAQNENSNAGTVRTSSGAANRGTTWVFSENAILFPVINFQLLSKNRRAGLNGVGRMMAI